MGMDGHPELLRRALDELGEDALGDQVGDVRPYGVHPEDEVGLGGGHDLEETVWLPLDERLADGSEGELGLLDLVALLLCLGLGEPERGDLGAAEGNARDQVLVHGHRVLAGHVLDGDDPLVPRRIHAVLGRPPILVHLDDAPVVHLDVGRVEVEVLGHGPAPDGDQERLGLQSIAPVGLAGRRVLAAVGAALSHCIFLLAGAGARDLYLHAVVGLLQASGIGLGAREDPHAASLELLLEGFGDLRVLQGDDTVEDLDYRHLGAEVVVHAGELDAHRAAAEDDDGLGVVIIVRRDVVARDDLLAVELQPRQRADSRSCGDQDVLGLELLGLAVVALYLYLLWLDKGTGAIEDLDLVLLHQALDAFAELVDDLLAALGGLRVVELDVAYLYPKLLAVPGIVELGRRLEERLGRDAADVQARPAEVSTLPLLYERHAHAELARPYGRDVTRVSAADYHEIELVRHPKTPFVIAFFPTYTAVTRMLTAALPPHHSISGTPGRSASACRRSSPAPPRPRIPPGTARRASRRPAGSSGARRGG